MGCGSGLVTMAMAHLSGSAAGIDIVPDAVAAAKAAHAAHYPNRCCAFAVADGWAPAARGTSAAFEFSFEGPFDVIHVGAGGQ